MFKELVLTAATLCTADPANRIRTSVPRTVRRNSVARRDREFIFPVNRVDSIPQTLAREPVVTAESDDGLHLLEVRNNRNELRQEPVGRVKDSVRYRGFASRVL